ncbi:MAG: trypsin-like peptidase domain-containing protein [Hyphomicrobiaceae bacterium]
MPKSRWPALAVAVLIAGSEPASGVPSIRLANDAGGPRVERIAIFGTDDRVASPSRYAKAADNIGLFFSNQSRTVCTAYCVAPNIVATAAHCLSQPDGNPAQLSDFMFARGYDRLRDYARIEGYQTGSSAQSIITGDFQHRVRPPIDAANDWALVRLNRPICREGGLQVTPMTAAQVATEAQAGRIFQLSYHRDWTQWRLAYSKPCAVARDFKAVPWTSIAPDFLNADKMLLHQCDTGGASSGSPLLLDRGGVVSVVGTNVGTYVQSKILTEGGQVTLREKAETVANTAVNAGVFASRIQLLGSATILSSGDPLRDLQRRLSDQRLYQARIDGSYGPVLRSAIEGYERQRRMPITGLPTHELLTRLNQEAIGLGQVSPSSALPPPVPPRR